MLTKLYWLIYFKIYLKYYFPDFYLIINIEIGDWGLGIGDCPIPNPQSPILLI